MGLNTYPYNPFPASTDKLDESHNEQIQKEVDQVKSDVTDLDNELTNLDNKIYGDAVTYPYADVITIEDAVPANVADCSVKIEPMQDLHGYDKPWVGGAGNNILNPTGNGTTYGDYSVTKNTDGSYTVTGGGTGEQVIAVLAGEFTVKANTEYHLNGCPTGGGSETYRLDVRTDGATIYQNVSDNGSGSTFTADEDETLYVYMRFGRGYAITGSVTFYPMICLASETDKSFAPYTNYCPITGHTEASVEVTDGDETTKTYTIALGDTIYGGEQNFNTGVCTTNNGLIEYNGDEEWSLNGTGTDTFYYQCATAISNTNRQAISNMLTRYGTTAFDTGVVGFCITNSGYVRVRTPQEMSLQDFKTWLANNPLQICYELATPTTVQLTPKQIQLLKGQNTITASTGDISVTVNGVSGAIGSLQTQANATDEALEELTVDIADKLPTAPTTDGAYVLTVTVASGTPTYSWESAE